jgi:predicted DNA-binding transcriptional regulator AlpA
MKEIDLKVEMENARNPLPKCVDARQVWEALGVAKTTFYQLRKRSDFPKPLDLGKAKRYRLDQILWWMHSNSLK